MSIGFTPQHTAIRPLNDLTQQQFLVLAIETAVQSGWRIIYQSEKGIVAHTNAGTFSWNAEIIVKIDGETASVQSVSTGNEMIDWGRNKKNTDKFLARLEKLKSVLSTEELDAKYEELKPQLVPEEQDLLQQAPETKTQQIKGILSIFRPTEGFFVTPILIDLNILLFALMVIGGGNIMQPDNETLLNWGANFRAVTLAGEWWRLITNCFLHIGIFHLLFNMYALLYIGLLLEPILGRIKFISAYLLTGIVASTASLWWHDMTISAGASGAIFGMYGVFFALLTTNLIEKTTRKSLLTSIAVFIGYNLLFGLKGGIDNAAHIGGLLSGFLIGYALLPSIKNPSKRNLEFGALGALTCLILISSFTVYKRLPNDIGIYDAKIKEFVAMEATALKIFDLPASTPKTKTLEAIENQGIYNWKRSIVLIDSFEKMDLPSSIKAKNKLLREYCMLRIESYELLYKAFSEDSNQYDEQLMDYNRQIEAKIKEMSLIQ